MSTNTTLPNDRECLEYEQNLYVCTHDCHINMCVCVNSIVPQQVFAEQDQDEVSVL